MCDFALTESEETGYFFGVIRVAHINCECVSVDFRCDFTVEINRIWIPVDEYDELIALLVTGEFEWKYFLERLELLHD